eukprot:scaffold14497_cov119-Cylindrotheca_fusiformis.AAC.11
MDGSSASIGTATMVLPDEVQNEKKAGVRPTLLPTNRQGGSVRSGRSVMTNLESVAELKDENNADYEFPNPNAPASAVTISSMLSNWKIEDSEPGTNSVLSSPTSSDKPRPSWTSERFASFETDGSMASFVESQDTNKKSLDSSVSSYNTSSKVSSSDEDDAISNIGLLGEFEQPPTNIFSNNSSKDGRAPSGGSFLSLPSLADYSIPDRMTMHSTTSSRIMPSLGETDEERLQLESSSISSFATLPSVRESHPATPSAPIATYHRMVNGKLQSDVLHRSELEGTTLDELSPCFEEKKPACAGRWSSDGSAPLSSSIGIQHREDHLDNHAGSVTSQTSNSTTSSSRDQPPMMMPRREAFGTLEQVTIRNNDNVGRMEQSPRIPTRRLSDNIDPGAVSNTIINRNSNTGEQSSLTASSDPNIARRRHQQEEEVSEQEEHQWRRAEQLAMSPMAASRRVEAWDTLAVEPADLPPVVARRHDSGDTLEDELDDV